jgi:hypothetical protein
MNTRSGKTTTMRKRFSRALALLSITAVALAASPTALATDRGGPGAPSAQELTSNVLFPVIRKLQLRFASWSD